ncbi:hypothetical protein GCM10009745_20560 [Kribbella yunnanensis]|uniref:Uncharacterized protein n=1 Tax=Kribbella yunnanensis TaxID=190194 RepID=A0ABP4SSM5_9ACTN
MPSETYMHCRVCGLLQPDPPWGEDERTPSYEICDCCGVEFGYEDSTPKGVIRARAKWKNSGFQWANPGARPDGWEADVQLAWSMSFDDRE